LLVVRNLDIIDFFDEVINVSAHLQALLTGFGKTAIMKNCKPLKKAMTEQMRKIYNAVCGLRLQTFRQAVINEIGTIQKVYKPH
jgi:hypothetical protein